MVGFGDLMVPCKMYCRCCVSSKVRKGQQLRNVPAAEEMTSMLRGELV